jgi:hypothetical protein
MRRDVLESELTDDADDHCAAPGTTRDESFIGE